MNLFDALAFVLAAFSVGTMLGHAAGYLRAQKPRRRRVGTPE